MGFGVLKFARLNKLKNSERNCRPSRSDSEIFFGHRHVGLCKSGALQNVAAGISIRAGERLDKRVGIEIPVGPSLDHLPRKIGIPGWSDRIACVAVIGWVVGQLRRERQSRLKRLDSADLPVSEKFPDPMVSIGSLPRPNGRS